MEKHDFGNGWNIGREAQEGERFVNISVQDVKRVARLARLGVSEQEAETFAAHLNDILQYVRKMEELDTSGVPPTSHVLPLANVMRDDDVRPSLPLAQAMKNAPDAADGQFRVPPVLD